MKGNLNREIGTLMSFVNTLGAEERPKRRHRNLYRLPLHWNLTCFWEPLTYFTSILHIKSSGNINSFNRKKPFHFEMSIRNWFAQLCEVDYWTVPPTSYPTKNSELKNWFSIFSVIFMVPLLNISWISWSTNFVSSFASLWVLGVCLFLVEKWKGWCTPALFPISIGWWAVSSNSSEDISIFLLWQFLQGTRLFQMGECGWTLLIIEVVKCWVMVSLETLLTSLGSPDGWPVCVKELLPQFPVVRNKETRWNGCFWRFLGSRCNRCSFNVPKNYLDFIFWR